MEYILLSSLILNIVLIGILLFIKKDKIISLNIPKKRKLADEWTDKDWGDLMF